MKSPCEADVLLCAGGCGKDVMRSAQRKRQLRVKAGKDVGTLDVMCRDCRQQRYVTCYVCGERVINARLPQGQAAHYACLREYRCKFPGCGVDISGIPWQERGGKLLCREHYRNFNHIKRANLHGVPYDESLDIDRVYQRCEWVCGLCLLPVDPSLTYPHKLSATLDHVVPLSKPNSPGHVYSNCQLAHSICNQVKNNSYAVDVDVLRELVLSIDPQSDSLSERKICKGCGDVVKRRGSAWHDKCLRKKRRITSREQASARRLRRRNGKQRNLARVVARQQLTEQVYELRAQGYSWQALADKFGYASPGAIYNAVGDESQRAKYERLHGSYFLGHRQAVAAKRKLGQQV